MLHFKLRLWNVASLFWANLTDNWRKAAEKLLCCGFLGIKDRCDLLIILLNRKTIQWAGVDEYPDPIPLHKREAHAAQ
jgi:hypothetical protein